MITGHIKQIKLSSKMPKMQTHIELFNVQTVTNSISVVHRIYVSLHCYELKQYFPT